MANKLSSQQPAHTDVSPSLCREMLFCTLTGQLIVKTEAAIKLHMAGKKFQRAKGVLGNSLRSPHSMVHSIRAVTFFEGSVGGPG